MVEYLSTMQETLAPIPGTGMGLGKHQDSLTRIYDQFKTFKSFYRLLLHFNLYFSSNSEYIN